MIQVWLLDSNGFYTGKVDFVEEPDKFQITVPYEIGYVKGKWNSDLQQWQEGATQEEIAAWEQENKIDICPEKTTEQKLEDLVSEYNQLKSRMDNTENAIIEIMSEA